MKVVNQRYLKEKAKYQELNYNFSDQDIIPIEWKGENYSKKNGVDMFKNQDGRIVLRKRHANLTGSKANQIPHYHYFIAESIEHGSTCCWCKEKRKKKVKCCGKLVNDFFTIHRCEEYDCCYESDYCVKCYISSCLGWVISHAGSCFISTVTGDFIVND